jgi:hypothetical protein
MDYQIKRFLLGLLTFLTIVSIWLWATAIEYEEQLTEPEYTVPVNRAPGLIVEEDLIDTGQQPEPPVQHGWILPPEPVRKSVGRVKNRIKQKNR